MNIQLNILSVLAVIEAAGIYFFIKFYNKYKAVSQTETSNIGFLKAGRHEVKGKIRALHDQFVSPLSQKSCVYYNFQVMEPRGSGKNTRWHTIINDVQHNLFGIDDGSGSAVIDIAGADLNLKTDLKADSGFLHTITPEMERALNKYKKTSKGLIFKKSMRYKEIILEEGDQLYVMGEVKDFDGYKPVFRKSEVPLYISDKSEKQILKELKTYLIIAGSILVIIPSIEAYILIRWLI